MTGDQREMVQRFAGSARAFCLLIEGCEALTPSALAREAASLLALLRKAGQALPDVAAVSENLIENHVSSGLAADVSRRVSCKFGRHNMYWEIYDPFEMEEPVAATLADDFADIYGELKDGLVTFDSRSERDVLEAVWHWRFGFENHRGRHLVDALRTLHRIISDHLLEEQAGSGR